MRKLDRNDMFTSNMVVFAYREIDSSIVNIYMIICRL